MTTHRYILFYKPYDVLSTFTDPEGRQTVGSYVTAPGVYAAGRLDQDSEGLMLLTDDGRLAHVLTDPAHKLPKTYFVQVENVPDKQALGQLRHGVSVKGEVTLPAEVELLDSEPDLPPRAKPIRFRPSIPTAWLRVVLREGRKRQIRHMTAAVGHPTLRIVRVAIGPLTLHGLQPGQWRDLTPEELTTLRNALGLNQDAGRAAGDASAEQRRPRAPREGARRPHTTDRAPRQGRAGERRSGARAGTRPAQPRARQQDERPASSGAGKGPQPPRPAEPDAPRRGRPPQNRGRRPAQSPRTEGRPVPESDERAPRTPPGAGGSRIVGRQPRRDINPSGRNPTNRRKPGQK